MERKQPEVAHAINSDHAAGNLPSPGATAQSMVCSKGRKRREKTRSF